MEELGLHSGCAFRNLAPMEDYVQSYPVYATVMVPSPPGSAPWRAASNCLDRLLPSDATKADKREFLISHGYLVD